MLNATVSWPAYIRVCIIEVKNIGNTNTETRYKRMTWIVRIIAVIVAVSVVEILAISPLSVIIIATVFSLLARRL